MKDKRIQIIYDLIDTILSVIRLLGLSRLKKTPRIQSKNTQCIIMGNGPSLLKLLEEDKAVLAKYDFLAVNHMARSAQYEKFKPGIYVLCDPAFWFAKGYEIPQQLVKETFKSMVDKTTWPLQLYIPYQAKKAGIKALLSSNSNIQVYYFNKTTFEGFSWLKYKIYDLQWGIVRPQNVLNVALMLMIYSGYQRIYLFGADNDWLKNVWVDEKNRIRHSEIHFYSENKEGKQICDNSQKLHMVLASLYIVFKNYVDIEEYAKKKRVKIYNMNPLSFIDAFEKLTCGLK